MRLKTNIDVYEELLKDPPEGFVSRYFKELNFRVQFGFQLFHKIDSLKC